MRKSVRARTPYLHRETGPSWRRGREAVDRKTFPRGLRRKFDSRKLGLCARVAVEAVARNLGSRGTRIAIQLSAARFAIARRVDLARVPTSGSRRSWIRVRFEGGPFHCVRGSDHGDGVHQLDLVL